MASAGPFWGRRQAFPKFMGPGSNTGGPKKHKFKQFMKTRGFSLNFAQICAGLQIFIKP
jgi:hypothetical protein